MITTEDLERQLGTLELLLDATPETEWRHGTILGEGLTAVRREEW